MSYWKSQTGYLIFTDKKKWNIKKERNLWQKRFWEENRWRKWRWQQRAVVVIVIVVVAQKKKKLEVLRVRPCCYFGWRNMASFFPELWPLERVSKLSVVNPTAIIFHWHTATIMLPVVVSTLRRHHRCRRRHHHYLQK